MKNSKIAIKLFLITTVVFVFFISVTLMCQILFFEKYYISKKQDNFEKDLRKLSGTIGGDTINQNTAIEKFKKFDDDNNSKTLLVNITEFNYRMINGTLLSDQGYMFFAFDKKLNGPIINMLIREWTLASRMHNDYVLRDKNTLIYQKNISGTNYIVGVAPIVKNNAVKNVIFSMVSLHPVGDAVNTMKEFYIYIYIFAILLIVILSYIFSLMISKPLVNLKKAATKMTELDFTTKCEVETRDEIGELGDALNFLSEKLDKTLGELRDSNEKLKEDIEKERQLEVMRKEFVAGVSHELKTPITLIGGYAEALKDNIVDSKDKDFFVDVILDESKKMDFLIKDMLDLSQLETGNLKMNLEEFNISELIGFVLKKFSKNIADKNLRVETDITEESAVVKGDVIRLEQVLVNLMSNAIRHVTEGGLIKLKVDNIGDKYMISIENEGNHIPEDELDKIWERFYKVDKSRNRGAEGTGIGLSIVKNILVLHDSTFGVNNTELGVKFYFSLKNC